MKRRMMLLTAAGAAGVLVVGWGALPQRSRLGSARLMLPAEGHFALNGWIKIATDGTVILAMPRSEMGQGVHTSLPMLAAEELDVPLSAVRIEQAGSDTIYGNVAMLVASLPFHPLEAENEDGFGRVKAGHWVVGKLARELGINATGGSSSVADAWEVVRMAAATARASLLGAASLQWRLPAEELTVKAGVISHPSGKSVGYGEMAKLASATPPGAVRLKDRKDWKLIGQPAARLDVPSKVDGTARFGLDVRPPGMRFAAIRLCPMLGGSPGQINADKALAMSGAERLVRLPAYAGSTAGFAVVGKSYWHASRAVKAVEVEWRQRPRGPLDSRQIDTGLEAAVRTADGYVFHEQGDTQAAERQAARKVESWYRAPYLAHATLEPMNCTAQVKDGKVEIWVPTQVPQMARAIAARVAGVSVDEVKVHLTLLGGGFGRRLEVDYVAQAVRVAMDCGGAPVQLIWSREEDTAHDFYRPMHVAMLRAAIDGQGNVASLRITSAGDAITPRWMARGLPALSGPVDTPDKTTAEGLFDLPYGFAHQHMEHVATRMGVPVGFWRSVGHSHNAFFSESFMDELAAETRQDPVEFRRKLLRGAPRYLAVLNLAAEKAGWGRKLPAGRALGVALHESFGSIVAQVAEVSVEGGKPRVHRVVCAVDCGTVVNPNIVAQQMESSVIFALTAALHGRIDIHDGVVQQGNFPSYPMVTMSQAPQVETWLVASQRPPGGVGEPGVPPLAPAVANALFALTGVRQRTLPLLPSGPLKQS
ncbi:xanthine dehydrogenase family protein molybdopterin-binding subunit [Ramlibacter sp. WS9]|uniref:xanthine dehydrogenase family protein molybdopterin-binding subunit n=1 Tax=Ramlibacter sp. WS9 TaxID=1882741 RepID=UPI00114328B3|nr:xanthine dehydrogenase family protein molybdopterin-binding subunit [Ramlibacter sp. WS9]ROZ74280.1 xanthine dehydrogenase family protein molybdopterin-binding subunit [Ramlibacter sp. WS9]